MPHTRQVVREKRCSVVGHVGSLGSRRRRPQKARGSMTWGENCLERIGKTLVMRWVSTPSRTDGRIGNGEAVDPQFIRMFVKETTESEA